MKEPKNCIHENFKANVDVQRLLDSGKFMADVRVSCVDCGSAFRFPGFPAGLDVNRATVSIDEVELHVPIEPEGEKTIRADAAYVVPAIPTRH